MAGRYAKEKYPRMLTLRTTATVTKINRKSSSSYFEVSNP